MPYLFLAALFICCWPDVTAQETLPKAATTAKINAVHHTTFPFIISLTSIEYDVTVNLKDQKVIDKYSPLFKRLNIPFTADAWEEIVTGLMQNSDSLMEHEITTSAQDGVLRIGTGGNQYQKAFIDYMLPIFSDLNHLEAILKKEE